MKDRVMFITGASGIAAESARMAGRRGALVFVASLDEAECAEVRESIRQEGGSCEYAAGDLSIAAQAEAAVRRCEEVLGPIEMAWNVAGISGRRYGDGPLHECSEEGWDRTMNANLRSMFLVNRAVLLRMMAREPDPAGRGAILNMSSVLAFSPSSTHFATHGYAASKGAIIALTRSMAAYYGPHGIRVNCLAPGLVKTPMSRRAQQDPAVREFIHRKQPLSGEMIEADQIAETALFLLSNAAAAITGQVVAVDGGWMVSGA